MEQSKPKVFHTRFKAQPVPDAVFKATTLSNKQVKKPTEVKPFQLQSNKRATRAKDLLQLNSNMTKEQRVFKANREYEKILKAKPWKPKIEQKRSTQTRQFTFQSEARAQKRKQLNCNFKSENQKENMKINTMLSKKHDLKASNGKQLNRKVLTHKTTRNVIKT